MVIVPVAERGSIEENQTISVVIYTRVSTDEQSRGYSISTQIEACRRFAAERGYCVLKEFTDDYTGESFERPGLDELRLYIASNPISIVLVHCMDRLARNLLFQLLIEEEFRKAGVRMEYVMGQYANTNEGNLHKNIQASISEYEKAKIKERTKRGMQGKAKAGFVLCGSRPPYGYVVRSEPHKSWLDIEKGEAEIVRMVYEWYGNGEGGSVPFSIQKIALRLTKMHIPTRGDKVKHVAKKRGFGIWTAAMVRHILTNETYTGVWYYGKTIMVLDGKKKEGKLGAKRGLGKQVMRPRAEWVPVDVPAIIGKETFDKARERRLINFEQSKRSARHEYLLGRRLRCAKCGYTYQGRTRNEKNQYYFCHGRGQRPVSLCDMPIFQAKRLETMVWEWLRSLLMHPDRLAQGLRGKQAEMEAANSVIRERKTLLDNSISKIQNQLEKLLDLYLEGSFPKEVLNDRKLELESDLSEMIRERTELSAYLIPVGLPNEDIEVIDPFVPKSGTGWKTQPSRISGVIWTY